MHEAKRCAGLTVLALAWGGGSASAEELDFPLAPPVATARTTSVPPAPAPRHEAPPPRNDTRYDPPPPRYEAPVARSNNRQAISPVRNSSRRAMCPEGPPAKILKYMEDSLQVVADESKPEEVRAAFQEAFDSIIDAAGKIRRSNEATVADKKEANQYEVSVLYQGAVGDLQLPRYRERLEAVADQLYKADGNKSDVAALAAFLLIKAKYETANGLGFGALAEIQNYYMKRFPRDEVATDLIADIALAAEQQGEMDHVRAAYDLAQRDFARSDLVLVRLPKINERLDLMNKRLDLKGYALGAPSAMLDLSKGAPQNRVTVVHFWSVYSKPCREELASLRDLQQRRSQDVGFIGVPIDGDPARVVEFLRDSQIDWTQIDAARTAGGGDYRESGIHPWASRYAIAATPTTFILDKEGRVQAMNVRGEQVELAVDAIIGGRKYVPPRTANRRPADELFRQ